MLFDIFIAFNMEERIEFCSSPCVEILNDKCFFYTRRAIPQDIGTYYLEFINTDFRNKVEFRNFVLKYCFIQLLSMADKDIDKIAEEKENGFPHRNFFTAKETEKYLDVLFKKFSKIIDEDRGLLADMTFPVRSYPPNFFEKHGGKPYKNKMDSARKMLRDEDIYRDALTLDFDLHFNMDISMKYRELYESIPYGFRSRDYGNIAYISLNYLFSYPSITFAKCANCNKWFIAKTSHYTKYCDDIYENGKTCKEIGAEKTFSKNLKENPVLKKHRQRYMSLASAVCNYPDNIINKERFENFKIEGAKKKADFLAGKISAKAFDNWIESTKVRKSNNM